LRNNVRNVKKIGVIRCWHSYRSGARYKWCEYSSSIASLKPRVFFWCFYASFLRCCH